LHAAIMPSSWIAYSVNSRQCAAASAQRNCAMNPNAEFDIIVYGATGYTGRLVAEYLAQRYGVGGEVKWAMAGRSAAKIAPVRGEMGAPGDTPLGGASPH